MSNTTTTSPPQPITSTTLTNTSTALLPTPNSNLSHYNNELIKILEDLRERREELNRSLLADEEEKASIAKEISRLTNRLTNINEQIIKKEQAKKQYDETIKQSEEAYIHIRDSSEKLLNVLKKERDTLGKKRITGGGYAT
jgi:Sjoegren syndrome nuclear autoantigen 1